MLLSRSNCRESMMKLVLVALLCVVPHALGHLALTFPPARRFAMDFLDNVRTRPPCGGMSYDGSKTTLKTGTPIKFTWQGVYPHAGGIRFELLNTTTNEIIANLTGDEYLYTNDSTIRHHQMAIGEAHVCDHCILRLIRQAGEWTANVPEGYLFWSCADVKIVSSSDGCYSGKCLNGGTCTSGTCTCRKTYTGDRCQYKNDCEDDSDCNNNGQCINIESTYFPTKVCFCNPGKMGRFCSKDSPVSEAVKTAGELEDYYHSQLYGDPSYDLYWKMMDGEIEFVVQVKTNNWVGLGWRPNSATAECSNFPVNSAIGGSTPEGNPETSPEGTAEPAGTPETRQRREVQFEVVGKVVRRLKREVENNILKDLCLAGNVTEALNWAVRNYNADASSAVPEPQPEGEATAPEGEAPTPEGEAPTPEGDTATPEGEVASTPEGGAGTPEGAGEPETVPEGQSPNFHPMDCQDIIIVAAVGNRHRILDSYTRDRSTPQPDSFFGGTDDLTAAAAARVDGVLHAVFRRKTLSADQADHTITDSPSTLIWARGQNPARVYHNPFTGMERCQASNYDFYKLNELKYHGTKESQRGSRTLNFFQNPDGSSSSSTGEHRSPADCSSDACNYVATWSHNKEENTVTFSITARVAVGQWAAIAFSEDQAMVNSDAVLVWMDNVNAQATISDRYITGKSPETVSAADDAQDSAVIASSYSNGMMTVSFTRPVDTQDDKDLSLNKCRFLLYAWGGDVTGGNARYHGAARRESSTSKICIASASGRSFLSNMLSWSWVMCVFLISKFSN